MDGTEKLLDQGKQMLEAVARRYAGQHGLTPDKVEWVNHGYEWLLKVIDAQHTVRVVFSPDEIEFFVEDGAENRATKMKIRNAFASLSM